MIDYLETAYCVVMGHDSPLIIRLEYLTKYPRKQGDRGNATPAEPRTGCIII